MIRNLNKYEFNLASGTVQILALDRWQAKRMARRIFKSRPVHFIEDGQKTEVLYKGHKNWARLIKTRSVSVSGSLKNS